MKRAVLGPCDVGEMEGSYKGSEGPKISNIRIQFSQKCMEKKR